MGIIGIGTYRQGQSLFLASYGSELPVPPRRRDWLVRLSRHFLLLLRYSLLRTAFRSTLTSFCPSLLLLLLVLLLPAGL